VEQVPAHWLVIVPLQQPFTPPTLPVVHWQPVPAAGGVAGTTADEQVLLQLLVKVPPQSDVHVALQLQAAPIWLNGTAGATQAAAPHMQIPRQSHTPLVDPQALDTEQGPPINLPETPHTLLA
jgi:hypothetical protein